MIIDKNIASKSKKVPATKSSKAKEVIDSSVQSNTLTENEKLLNHIKQFMSGQDEAARHAVSIFSSNARRNNVLDDDLRMSIKPPHSVFHGPTGCGKSYLIGIMAKYKNVPFIKVEATQYTEIGYVGRDVESMIKDLVEKSIQLIKEKYLKEIKAEVEKNVCSQIIQVIVGANTSDETFKMFCTKLSNGELDNKEIEIEVSEDHSGGSGFSIDMPGGNSHTQVGMFNLGDMMGKILGKKGTKKIKTNVRLTFIGINS